MADAGKDISIFKAHSIRRASCSTAAGVGVTNKVILDAADWSSEGTFQQFYCREQHLVLQFSHPKHLQTMHVDMKLSLPMCNL